MIVAGAPFIAAGALDDLLDLERRPSRREGFGGRALARTWRSDHADVFRNAAIKLPATAPNRPSLRTQSKKARRQVGEAWRRAGHGLAASVNQSAVVQPREGGKADISQIATPERWGPERQCHSSGVAGREIGSENTYEEVSASPRTNATF